MMLYFHGQNEARDREDVAIKSIWCWHSVTRLGRRGRSLMAMAGGYARQAEEQEAHRVASSLI